MGEIINFPNRGGGRGRGEERGGAASPQAAKAASNTTGGIGSDLRALLLMLVWLSLSWAWPVLNVVFACVTFVQLVRGVYEKLAYGSSAGLWWTAGIFIVYALCKLLVSEQLLGRGSS